MSAPLPHMRLVSLRLPLDLIARIEEEAHALGLSPAETIRRVLRDAFEAQAPIQDEPSGPLPEMAAIQEALDRSGDWLDLQRRLRAQGFVLRESGRGRLVLHDWPENRALMPLDELGVSAAELVLRYRAPFPGGVGSSSLPKPIHPPLSEGVRAHLRRGAANAA